MHVSNIKQIEYNRLRPGSLILVSASQNVSFFNSYIRTSEISVLVRSVSQENFRAMPAMLGDEVGFKPYDVTLTSTKPVKNVQKSSGAGYAYLVDLP